MNYISTSFAYQLLYTLGMKYIEVIVLINILIHISFIRLSNYILRRKNNWIAIIITCFMDAIYVVLYLLVPDKIESFKYIFILVLSIIPFVSRSLTTTLFNTIIYLMFNFILGGFTGIIIKIINHYWIVIPCLIIINIVFSFYAVYRRIHSKELRKYYDIAIKNNGKDYILKGFYDTGNLLVTEDNIPVVIVNQKYKSGSFVKRILIKTVTGSEEIELYKVNCFEIKVDKNFIKKDVYIAYSDIKFDVLFGNELLGG